MSWLRFPAAFATAVGVLYVTSPQVTLGPLERALLASAFLVAFVRLVSPTQDNEG